MKTKRRITTVDGLLDAGYVAAKDAKDLAKVAVQFSVRLTPHVRQRIIGADLSDPVLAQYVPSVAELRHAPDEVSDPIGDDIHEKAKGVTHRYPDRVLLKPTHTCQVYCRFCFRREKVGKADEALDRAELTAALAYIRRNSNIWEVILSGGDPLVLSDRRLAVLMEELSRIAHVAVVRIHTRAPIADPARVGQAFIKALKIRPAVFVVVHVNHARELSPEVARAISLMVDNGIPVLSQTVLLRGVNNDAKTISTLMKALVALRVKPYYLHHLDRARGTSHFRCSIAEGQRLMQDLRGAISGLCLPTYMLDIPGGFGKVPIGPTYLGNTGEQSYIVRDYRGGVHEYRDGTGPEPVANRK